MKQQKQFLLCVLGIQLSGKTTLAKLVAEELAVPFVSIDAIRISLHGHLSGPKDWRSKEETARLNQETKIAYDHFFRLIESNVLNGQSLVIEMPHLGSREQALVELTKANNCDLKIIWCYISQDTDEEISQRIAQRSLNKDVAPIRLEDYRNLKGQKRKPEFKSLELDTIQPIKDSVRIMVDYVRQRP